MNNLTFGNLFKKDSLVLIMKILMPGILVVSLLVACSAIFKIEFGVFSQDVLPMPYIGILSNIGVIFWSVTIGILLFSYTFLERNGKDKSENKFFFFAGLLTIFLLIDDFFEMHDNIFPRFLFISENWFYAIYAFSVLAILYFYRKFILGTDYILLLLSLVFLGSSIFSDIISALNINVPHLLIFEDGFKFLGITLWFAYFSRTSYKFVKQEVSLKY